MKISEIAGTTAAAGTEAGAVGTPSSSAGSSFIVAWERYGPNLVDDGKDEIEKAKMTKTRGAVFKRSHLAWPDKAGLVTAALIAVLSTIICATVLMAAGSVFYVNSTTRWRSGLSVPSWQLPFPYGSSCAQSTLEPMVPRSAEAVGSGKSSDSRMKSLADP